MKPWWQSKTVWFVAAGYVLPLIYSHVTLEQQNAVADWAVQAIQVVLTAGAIWGRAVASKKLSMSK